jgi:hypothetical protein
MDILLLYPDKYGCVNIHDRHQANNYYPVANSADFSYTGKPEPETKVDYP